MGINLTIEAIVVTVGSIPIFLSAFMYFLRYRFHPDRVLLYFTCAWFFLAMWILTTGLSYLLLIPELFLYKSVFMILLAICFEMALSIIYMGKINHWRFAIIVGLCTLILHFTLTNDGIVSYTYPSGDNSYILTGNLLIHIRVVTSYIVIFYIIYAFQIYRYSPPDLKYFARLNLIGTTLFGPISTIVFIFQWNKIIPGLVELFLGIGLVISSYALLQKPELLHLLPFKAMKLFVIEKYSGNILFTHNWDEEFEDIPNELISSALEGITMFVNETMRRGKIEHIQLTDAHILVKEVTEIDVYFVLISTEPSYVLGSGLELFSKYFVQKYGEEIASHNEVQETTRYNRARELVIRAFPYIPKSKSMSENQ